MRTVRSRHLAAFVALALLLAAPGALSQERPSFEVASVRPAPEHRGRPLFAASPRPPFARSSGRFDATATLRDLITWAFGLQFPMEGSFRELDDVFVTAFDPRSEPEAAFWPAEDLSSLPSLRDALRHDLGFKLESERRDFPVLVVEHVEQPTEN